VAADRLLHDPVSDRAQQCRSPDQIEAARLDGAKGWKMLWHVILPQLWPATFLAIVVTVIGALRSFDMIAIMTQGGPYGSSNVLSYLHV
jgi:multiple sugar transport system permease protein